MATLKNTLLMSFILASIIPCGSAWGAQFATSSSANTNADNTSSSTGGAAEVMYEGYNDVVSVPTDMEYLSMLAKDDHDCRAKIHKQDVRPRRSHGPLNRIVLNPAKEEVLSGTRIAVELENRLDSRVAKIGDQVQGKLMRDFYAYNILVAPKGSTVYGKVVSRADVSSQFSPEIKFLTKPGVQLAFDTLDGVSGEKLEFNAIPATNTDIERGPEHTRAYSILENGYVGAKTNGLPFGGGTFGFTTGTIHSSGVTIVVLKPGDRMVLEVQKNMPVHEQSVASAMFE